MHVGVYVGLCACACAHNTHMHTHTHLSTPDFVVKALGIFKRNQCVFVVVAASKFLIPGTSKEPAIHCLYSILGAKNFWKHFRRFPKFILSWNLSSDSWLPVFQPSQHGVLNIAQVFPNSSSILFMENEIKNILNNMQCWEVWWETGALECRNTVAMRMLLGAYIYVLKTLKYNY